MICDKCDPTMPLPFPHQHVDDGQWITAKKADLLAYFSTPRATRQPRHRRRRWRWPFGKHSVKFSHRDQRYADLKRGDDG